MASFRNWEAAAEGGRNLGGGQVRWGGQARRGGQARWPGEVKYPACKWLLSGLEAARVNPKETELICWKTYRRDLTGGGRWARWVCSPEGHLVGGEAEHGVHHHGRRDVVVVGELLGRHGGRAPGRLGAHAGASLKQSGGAAVGREGGEGVAVCLQLPLASVLRLRYHFSLGKPS